MGFILYDEFKDIYNQSEMSSLQKLSVSSLVYKKAKKIPEQLYTSLTNRFERSYSFCIRKENPISFQLNHI